MKKILFTVAALVILVLIATVLMPAHTHVERSVTIAAPAPVVYRYISNFHDFNRWSPWAQRDPETQYEFTGPDTGVGSTMTWSSEHPEVGSGSQRVIAAEPPHKLTIALKFGDNTGSATSTYILQPQTTDTQVTWTFDSDNDFNPVNRFVGLMMDNWLGPDYEQGLANLKKLIETEAVAAIQTKEIPYEVNGTQFTGYLAYPISEQPQQYPGVLVVHEWWGLNDYARQRAEMLAQVGYVALALDMYGDDKVAHHPDDAMKFMNEATQNTETAKARFDAAHELLKAQAQTDPERIAAIGYCFGGAVVLNMARAGADLDAVASFHGSLQAMVAPAQPGSVKAKVMVFNGADDPFVPPEQKQAFRLEMDSAEVEYEFIDYPGAKHSFTVPGVDAMAEQFNMPLQYDAAADSDSWQRLLVFLDKVFSGGKKPPL